MSKTRQSRKMPPQQAIESWLNDPEMLLKRSFCPRCGTVRLPSKICDVCSQGREDSRDLKRLRETLILEAKQMADRLSQQNPH